MTVGNVPDVADEVFEGSFFADASSGHVAPVALLDAVVRAATAAPADAGGCRPRSVEVAFPGPFHRGVPTHLVLDPFRPSPDVRAARFEVAQRGLPACVGTIRFADGDDLFAPWVATPGRRAPQVLVGKDAPWRVLIGPPRRTPEGAPAADVVGPSAPGDTGARPVSLLLDAACQLLTAVARAGGEAPGDAELLVSAAKVTTAAGEPWDVYPELVCRGWRTVRAHMAASVELRVGGEVRGELAVRGRFRSSSVVRAAFADTRLTMVREREDHCPIGHGTPGFPRFALPGFRRHP
ncbi:hypothetical protein [Saccharothrix obliqua]|uniref:hypothetical protein n=1 Tax=Saccharothrix obliqua TaxID=2861747 RepID=UPI001C5EB8A1|nr:hypothetical protein [Saccharothrix obliqua]MBW4721409.1 hypothetical protein [Saccharothrix obliqua]